MGKRSVLPASSGKRLASTKTLSEILADIAFPVGSSDAPQKVRALTAFHMALDWLQAEHDWSYYHDEGTQITTVSGTRAYTLESAIRKINEVWVETGSPRVLRQKDKSVLDRQQPDQTGNSLPLWYYLAYEQADQEIYFFPTPQSAETISIDYYRDPGKPTALSQAPDIASWMETPLILHSQGLVAKWKGRPDANDWFALAEDAKTSAIEFDLRQPDAEDSRFIHETEVYTQVVDWKHPDFREGY